MVTARSWCRVDLAGGTLDIWPLGLLHSGARTVNVALDAAVEVRLCERESGYRVVQGERVFEASSIAELSRDPESALVGVIAADLGLPPVEIEIASASPRGAGLAASSALSVALLRAGEGLSARAGAGSPSGTRETVRRARDLEARLMGLPTGIQDHYPALLGGALEIVHEAGGEKVRSLDADLEALAASLLIVYTGKSHFSAGKNWQVIRRRLEQDPEVVELFEGITGVSSRMPAALEAGDLPRVGSLMAEEWSFRRKLADGVSNLEIEELLCAAAGLGAWGGKACGAGGGGCVAILGPPERKAAIAERLTAAGGEVIAASPQAEPMELELESIR